MNFKNAYLNHLAQRSKSNEKATKKKMNKDKMLEKPKPK